MSTLWVVESFWIRPRICRWVHILWKNHAIVSLLGSKSYEHFSRDLAVSLSITEILYMYTELLYMQVRILQAPEFIRDHRLSWRKFSPMVRNIFSPHMQTCQCRHWHSSCRERIKKVYFPPWEELFPAFCWVLGESIWIHSNPFINMEKLSCLSLFLIISCKLTLNSSIIPHS